MKQITIEEAQEAVLGALSKLYTDDTTLVTTFIERCFGKPARIKAYTAGYIDALMTIGYPVPDYINEFYANIK